MRILFIGNSRLGDFVLASGLLATLIQRYPAARLTIACGPSIPPLLSAMPNVERVIVQRKRPFHGHWRDLWRQTVGTRWDLVVDLRDSAVSRLIWARAVKRWRPPAVPMHRVEAIASVLDLPAPPNPRLSIGPAQRDFAAALLPDRGHALALAPGATTIAKQWSPESFAALAMMLTGPGGAMAGAKVVALGSPDEQAASDPLRAMVPPDRLIDLVGKTDPLQAAAIIERCAVFVGNDGGLMHVAAATGIPTLGLFGPTPPEPYRPWGENGVSVATDIPYAKLAAQLRAMTGPRTCLMESLPMEKVAAAVRLALAAAPAESTTP